MNKEEAKRCVGKGWANIIDEFYNRMSKDASVFSVKEKFGCLRIDGVGTLDLEMEMEKRSSTICEECGKDGETRDLPWILTLCDEHYIEHKNKITE